MLLDSFFRKGWVDRINCKKKHGAKNSGIDFQSSIWFMVLQWRGLLRWKEAAVHTRQPEVVVCSAESAPSRAWPPVLCPPPSRQLDSLHPLHLRPGHASSATPAGGEIKSCGWVGKGKGSGYVGIPQCPLCGDHFEGET